MQVLLIVAISIDGSKCKIFRRGAQGFNSPKDLLQHLEQLEQLEQREQVNAQDEHHDPNQDAGDQVKEDVRVNRDAVTSRQGGVTSEQSKHLIYKKLGRLSTA